MSEKTSNCRHSVTPYLIVSDVAELVAFLEKAFDAEEFVRLGREDGSVMHGRQRDWRRIESEDVNRTPHHPNPNQRTIRFDGALESVDSIIGYPSQGRKVAGRSAAVNPNRGAHGGGEV